MYHDNRKLKRLLFGLVIVSPLVLLIGIGSYFVFSNNTIIYGEFVLVKDLTPIRSIDNLSSEGLNVVATGNQIGGFSLHATTIEDDDFSFVDDEMVSLERHLNLSTIDDTIYIVFENSLPNVREYEERATTARVYFILKIFYNFEEIPFRVLNQSSVGTEFLFSLSEGYQIQIPVQLLPEITDVVDDGLGNLSIGVFATPHYHTVDPLAQWYYYCPGCAIEFVLSTDKVGVVSNFTISFMETVESQAEHESDVLGNVALRLTVNPEFQVEQFEGLLTSVPPSPWTVSSGEEVKIGFALYLSRSLAPSPLLVDDFKIVGLLNWEQIELNGMHYFLYHNDLEARGVIEGYFVIQAPAQPGYYDFVAFAVANLKETISPQFSDVAWRFTLRVTDN